MSENAAIFLCLSFAYALVCGLGAWLIIDNAHKRTLAHEWQDICTQVFRPFKHALRKIRSAPVHALKGFAYWLRRRGATAAALKWHAAPALTILLLPLAATLLPAFSPHLGLPGYDELPGSGDPVVLALLQGEQLAPPPPLPPELFIAREVEAIRAELGGASREWQTLDADFRQRLLTVFHLMSRKGYQMALLEGYRSPARQTYLASLGTHVTNAGAYQSYHQFGLAADSAFLRDGKLVISEKDPWAMEGYRLYGEMAESVGLVWGGRWKMRDFGHVELRSAGTTALAKRNQFPK